MIITEELIRSLVIEVVEKIEALKSAPAPLSADKQQDTMLNSVEFEGKVLSATDVEYYKRRKILTVRLRKKTILTPLAKERAKDLGVLLEWL